MEQFHKFAGRSGRNTHLLDQVEEFRGGHYGSKAGIHHEGTEEAASVMRLYLPNLRAYRSRAFSRSLVSMKVFTKFQYLRTLELSCHRLSDLPPDFQLPLLESLLLKECFVAMATCQRLLMPTCTPKLRKMHLDCVIMHSTSFLIAAPDLRRLEYLQLVAWDRQHYSPQDLGFHRVQNIVHGWSVGESLLRFPTVPSLGRPLHLRLYPRPERSERHSDYDNYNDELEETITSMANTISQGLVKSLFLPTDFDDTAWSDHRHTRELFFLLLKACRDFDIPVIIYDERELEDDFLPAFDRFLASRGNTDVRDRLLQENIERVRIWEEYTTEHQLEYPPARESSGGDLGDTDS